MLVQPSPSDIRALAKLTAADGQPRGINHSWHEVDEAHEFMEKMNDSLKVHEIRAAVWVWTAEESADAPLTEAGIETGIEVRVAAIHR